MPSNESSLPSPVRLRPLTGDELRALAAGHPAASLPPLAGAAALPPTFVLQRAAARLAGGGPPRWWMPCLVLRADGVVVGGCAFKGPPEAGRVDILYGIARECRGQGFATQAVREMVRLAFEGGATRVRAEIEAGNEASRRTVRACGFAAAGSWTDEDGTEVTRFELSIEATPTSACAPSTPGAEG